jgi:twitching motility protein PilT
LDIRSLLDQSVAALASDLYLSVGLVPMARIMGEIEPLAQDSITAENFDSMMQSIMTQDQAKQFEQERELDFAFQIPGLARFRVNCFRQYLGKAAVLRIIPIETPTLAKIGGPQIFADLMMRPRGLVLVTGPTGAGKSTTLAALVNHLNESRAAHILTVEDPIEFIHSPKKGLVNQREVGQHTESFSTALYAALREAPDAIMVGQMRDLETISQALTAAETGHLVMSTLHTTSAPKTVDRIVDVFPAREKEMVRTMLAESLEAVISQTLCRRADGKGRVLAYEIMLTNPAIRNMIREGKTPQMYSAMQTGGDAGMVTLDQSLSDLVERGVITQQEARSKARDLKNFR